MPAQGKSLMGQVAVISGGGRGIGRAVAHLFSANGADIALCARTPSELSDTASELKANGTNVVTRIVDISIWEEVEGFASAVTEKLGPTNILINNAASGTDTEPLAESDPSSWAKVATTNMLGPYFMSRAFMSQLAYGAHIINVGSGNGHTPVLGRSAYGVGKAGLSMLTKCMALELWDRGIRVNEFIPGPTATRMLPWATNIEDEDEIVEKFANLPSPENPSEKAKTAETVAKHVLWLAEHPPGGPTGQVYSLMRRPI